MNIVESRVLRVGLALSALFLVNCGSDTSTTTGSNGGGTGGATTAGGSTSTSSVLDKFAGAWTFISGTDTINCSGQTSTSNVTGTLTITKGSTSDLVVTNAACNLKFTVVGSTASANAGQSCSTTDATGTEVDTVNSLVISLSADGTTATISSTITGVISGSGASYTCTITESSTIQKV
jgi:hypothetical protein